MNFFHKSKKKAQKTSNPTNQTDKKKYKILIWWQSIERGNKIQIVLVILNIVMVGAFIIFSQKQIYKTKEALKLTRESINLAKENARTELRAYIITQIDSIEALNDTFIIFLSEINVGKTPTYKLRKNVIFNTTEFVDSEWVKLKKLPKTTIDIGGSVHQASQNFYPYKEISPTPQFIKRLFYDRKFTIYMAVCVEYRDFWGDIHHTHSYWGITPNTIITMNKYNDSN